MSSIDVSGFPKSPAHGNNLPWKLQGKQYVLNITNTTQSEAAEIVDDVVVLNTSTSSTAAALRLPNPKRIGEMHIIVLTDNVQNVALFPNYGGVIGDFAINASVILGKPSIAEPMMYIAVCSGLSMVTGNSFNVAAFWAVASLPMKANMNSNLGANANTTYIGQPLLIRGGIQASDATAWFGTINLSEIQFGNTTGNNIIQFPLTEAIALRWQDSGGANGAITTHDYFYINSTLGLLFNNKQLIRNSSDNLTALSGGGQSGATAITADSNRFTTVAASGDSGILQTPQLGLEQVVFNDGAQTLDVYPIVGAQINALGTNNPFTIAAGAAAIFRGRTATQYTATAL